MTYKYIDLVMIRNFIDMPLCILQYICDAYLSPIDTIYLSQMNKKCSRIKIKRLHDIPNKFRDNLTNDILNKYEYLEELNISDNPNVINIKHVIHLKKLDMSRYCQALHCLNNNFINLVDLNIKDNAVKIDLNHLINLRKLDISGYCCVDDNDIEHLVNLEELIIQENTKINTVYKFTNLKKLDISGYYNKIRSIDTLTNLEELYISNNKHIFDINCLVKLKKLFAESGCKVSNDGIKKLINLKELYAQSNNKLSNFTHLINLKILCASDMSETNIAKLTNLEDLQTHAFRKHNINDNNIQYLTKLKKLHIGSYVSEQKIINSHSSLSLAHITNKGIKNMINVEELDVSGNQKITNINHMRKLKILDARGNSCGITQKYITNLTNLTKLDISYNVKISNVNTFVKLKHLIVSGNNKINIHSVKKLTNLETLDISKCDNINTNILNDLKNLKIIK